MRPTWTLLWQPDDAQMTAWLPRLPDRQVRHGSLVAACDRDFLQTVDGKALGVFDGVLFNDREMAEPLIGRGAPVQKQAGLVLHAIGWSGLQGLGAMRWHGTLAVVHQAQRTAIVARDWLGVGGLYWAPLAGGHAFANTLQGLSGLGLHARLVPPGMLALCGPSGVQWRSMPSQPENRAWFRELPDELSRATPAIWQQGLLQRLNDALQASQRALPRLSREQPTDRAGLWLAEHFPLANVAQPDALWTLVGADAWLGLSSALPLEVQPGPWPEPEPPEPLRVDDREVVARRVRATWLADVALEGARALAQARNVALVAPHLDPAVLAWLGAMPRALRPLS